MAKTGNVAQTEFITVQMNIAKALFDPEVRTEYHVRVDGMICDRAHMRFMRYYSPGLGRARGALRRVFQCKLCFNTAAPHHLRFEKSWKPTGSVKMVRALFDGTSPIA